MNESKKDHKRRNHIQQNERLKSRQQQQQQQQQQQLLQQIHSEAATIPPFDSSCHHVLPTESPFDSMGHLPKTK
jgi:hypothetical protein